MIINDLGEIKTIIINNLELCRLHDYLRFNWNDPCVNAVTSQAQFNCMRISWYTIVNSLYSSISLINQYINNQGDSPNSLDGNFTFASWHIDECYEYNDSGARNVRVPDLERILRRLRNSISHGMFYLDTSADSALDYEIIFKDINDRTQGLDKNFIFKMKVRYLDNFLQKVEYGFNLMYP